MEYAALFEPAEEGGFVITIPDFGWGFSQGETEVEARQMANPDRKSTRLNSSH